MVKAENFQGGMNMKNLDFKVDSLKGTGALVTREGCSGVSGSIGGCGGLGSGNL